MAVNDNNNQNQQNNPEPNPNDAKYSQDEYNKGMANKEREVEKKFKAQYEGKKVFSDEEYQQAIKDAMSKGAERAQMSADEKAKAEFADKQKAIEAKEKAFQEKMDAFDRDRALSNTKEALIDADLPKELAPFLTDTDEDKRTSNIKTVGDIIHKAVDAAVDERLKGKKTPETGSNNPSATGMPKTRQEFIKLPINKQQEILNSNPDYVKEHFYI